MFLFYWLIAIMPLDQHPFWGRELFGTFTIVKLVGTLCLLVALSRILSDGRSPAFFRTRQAVWFAVLWALQLLSYPIQGGRLANGTMAYSHVFSILSLFVATLALVDSAARLRRSLLVAVAAMGFASLYAIRQWQKYGGTYQGFRPAGMLADANEFALVAGLWIPLAFILAFSRRPAWERALGIACLPTMLLGVTFAASRGGFLGLAAALLFVLWHSPRRARNVAIAGALGAALVLFSPVSPLRRFTAPGRSEKLSEIARLTAWKAGLKMIAAHPLTGVGLHNFKPLVARYEGPGPKVVSLAHNTYIELAAELGLAALLVFLVGLGASFAGLRRARRRAQAAGREDLANLALALQAGMVAYLTSAFFVTAWWQKMVWLQLFLAICLQRVVDRRVAPFAPEMDSEDDAGTAMPLCGCRQCIPQ